MNKTNAPEKTAFAHKWWEHKRELTAEQMLDEELMVCGLGELDSFQSPFDALHAILNFYDNCAKSCEE